MRAQSLSVDCLRKNVRAVNKILKSSSYYRGTTRKYFPCRRNYGVLFARVESKKALETALCTVEITLVFRENISKKTTEIQLRVP